jgi:hypothetical protein
MPFENVYGPGGVLSTVDDMLIWNQALDDGRLGAFVTGELHREAQSTAGRPLGYSRGLFVGKYKNHRMVSHGGTTGAYQAALARYPDAGLSIVVLCNADEAPTGDIQEQVIDMFLPQASAEPKAATGERFALTAQDAQALAGTYLSDFTGLPLAVTSEGNVVKLRGNVLEPVSKNRFRRNATEIVFSGNSFERIDGTKKETFRKTDNVLPTPRELEAVAGHYWSDETGSGYIATVEKGKLVLRSDQRSNLAAPFDAIGKDVFTKWGMVVRVQRTRAGAPSALAFSVPRIRELRFHRVAPGFDKNRLAAASK